MTSSKTIYQDNAGKYMCVHCCLRFTQKSMVWLLTGNTHSPKTFICLDCLDRLFGKELTKVFLEYGISIVKQCYICAGDIYAEGVAIERTVVMSIYEVDVLFHEDCFNECCSQDFLKLLTNPDNMPDNVAF